MKAKFDVIPHLEDLWRYARVLTRSDDRADDLVQEALARALTFATTYDSSHPLLPWLIKIVRNTFLTNMTSEKAEKHRLDCYATFTDKRLLPSQEHSVELSDVRKALLILPVEQAEVLHLVGVLGFTYSETAEALGVPVGTVMSRLSRARIALRDVLEANPERSGTRALRIVGGHHGRR